jgi:hypothetical protein
MTRSDNRRFLAVAVAQRHRETLQRAEEAVERLHRAGRPVNFSAVARAASVSRAWLYSQPELRAAIRGLRVNVSVAAVQPASAQGASSDSLRQRVAALRAENARLRLEKAALEDQLARKLGRERSSS